MNMEKCNLDQLTNKKVAFVCSGGVVKAAAWHLGVSMALEEVGFKFKSNKVKEQKNDLMISTYVGSSAGSLMALYLASGYHPNEIIQSHLQPKKSKLNPITYKHMLSLTKPLKKPPRSELYNPFESFPPLLRTLLKPISNFSGFFTSYGLSKYLQENVLISNSFEDYDADIFIVGTQLDHSKKVIFSKYNYPSPAFDDTAFYYTGYPISEVAAASMSVPVFYSPYPLKIPNSEEIQYYIDGEIRETLSTHVAADNGCEYIICSWTHSPYHFNDEIGSLINYGLPAIGLQSIYLMIQKKILASRSRISRAKAILDSVNDYMAKENLNEKHRKEIIAILAAKLDLKPNVKVIDIYPDYDNYKMFFSSNFSLDTKAMTKVVKMGYSKALRVFEEQQWV